MEIDSPQKLWGAFAVLKGSSIELARTMTSYIYDIENEIIVNNFITKYATSERKIAIRMINELRPYLNPNDLFLVDRGYPTLDLFDFLLNLGIKFVIRTPIDYYKSRLNPTICA